jgi:hypothetical protein
MTPLKLVSSNQGSCPRRGSFGGRHIFLPSASPSRPAQDTGLFAVVMSPFGTHYYWGAGGGGVLGPSLVIVSVPAGQPGFPKPHCSPRLSALRLKPCGQSGLERSSRSLASLSFFPLLPTDFAEQQGKGKNARHPLSFRPGPGRKADPWPGDLRGRPSGKRPSMRGVKGDKSRQVLPSYMTRVTAVIGPTCEGLGFRFVLRARGRLEEC